MKNTIKILSRVVLIGFICVLFGLGNTAEVKAAGVDIHYGLNSNGSVNGPNEADLNEEVTFTVTPNEGYYINSVTVNLTPDGSIPHVIVGDNTNPGKQTQYKFTAPANGSLIDVNITFNQCGNAYLNVNINGSGTTSPTAGTHQYLQFQEVAITATPDPGNIFMYWTSDKGTFVDNTNASTTVALIIDHTGVTPENNVISVTAHFATAPTITFDANGGSCTTESAQVGTNRKLASLPTATRDGQTCTGWFTAATGGDPVTTNTEFTSNTRLYAHWTGTSSTNHTITVTTDVHGTGRANPEPEPKKDDENNHARRGFTSKKNNDDKGREEEHSSKPVVVNPDTVEGFFAVNGQILPGVAMGKMKQGPAAQAVFNANRPVGWKEAFTFNIAINGKVDYTLKNGTLTFIIPKEYQKAGRTFAVMALDKNGKAWTFADIDTNPSTLTANINVEGYAFALIYKDG